MSKSSNRGARKLLEQIYGKRCMICGRRLKKKGVATYHHIRKLSDGGKTTVENGGLVCKYCHPLIHESPESEVHYNRIILNYKRRHS